VAVYVVRHAKAGDRDAWDGDDRLRPLTKSGWRQAEALVELFKDVAVQAVHSSPYLRCIQTVEPLARQYSLRVEQEKALAEGAGGESLIRLVHRAAGREVVLCTHGDLLEELLQRLVDDGLVSRARAGAEKGSTWVLEETQGRISGARYIPSP
jgi:broad specificity phosphatase PhoE